MNDMSTVMPDPLVFTDNAANKVKALIEEEGNNELKLRVFVTGGGCSGLQYGFTFDEVSNEDDTVMEKNGVQLLIDPMSYQYLVGAEIDYSEGLEGAPSDVYRVAVMAWADKAAMERDELTAEWTALRMDAGQMIERFGVTLTSSVGSDA